MLGRTFGHYQVLKKLGEGGMGAVFLAEHQLIRKRVAIKVLLPELAVNDEILKRFFNEAVAATQIRDPGIVEIFDYGVEAGGAYIVMELLEGEPLSDRMARGPLDPPTALRLVRQAAGALAAAHEIGIIHRDLKPENLFLVPDPEVAGGERVKILDFGIARLSSEAGRIDLATRTGSLIGTPAYMAPEQCAGARDIDGRADLYALGVILYEMVVGQPPFHAQGLGELLALHMFEPPRPPRSIAPGVSAAIDALILRLLAKLPSDRVPSARALVDEIARLEGAESGRFLAASSGAPARGPSGAGARGLTTTLGAAAAQTVAPAGSRIPLAATAVGLTALATLAALTLVTLDAGDRATLPLALASAPAALDAGVRAPAAASRDAAPAPADAGVTPDAAPRPTHRPAPARRIDNRSDRRRDRESAGAAVERARAALASGNPRRALEIARELSRDPRHRSRGYALMTLAYCTLHNDEAARAVYGRVPARRRAPLRRHCRSKGIELE